MDTLKKALERALTPANGGWMKLIGPEGRLSGPYVLAFAIRAAIIVAAVWAAMLLGLPVEAILEFIGFQAG